MWPPDYTDHDDLSVAESLKKKKKHSVTTLSPYIYTSDFDRNMKSVQKIENNSRLQPPIINISYYNKKIPYKLLSPVSLC